MIDGKLIHLLLSEQQRYTWAKYKIDMSDDDYIDFIIARHLFVMHSILTKCNFNRTSNY